MVCCVFQATNLVNNYRPRKSARIFVSRQKASNKLYTVLAFRCFLLSKFPYFILNILLFTFLIFLKFLNFYSFFKFKFYLKFLFFRLPISSSSKFPLFKFRLSKQFRNWLNSHISKVLYIHIFLILTETKN
jgi:hypothetical protein